MASTVTHLKLSLVGLALSSLAAFGCASPASNAPPPKYGNGSTAEAPMSAPPVNPNDTIVFQSTPRAAAPAPAPQSAPAMSISPAKSSSSGRLSQLH